MKKIYTGKAVDIELQQNSNSYQANRNHNENVAYDLEVHNEHNLITLDNADIWMENIKNLQANDTNFNYSFSNTSLFLYEHMPVVYEQLWLVTNKPSYFKNIFRVWRSKVISRSMKRILNHISSLIKVMTNNENVISKFQEAKINRAKKDNELINMLVHIKNTKNKYINAHKDNILSSMDKLIEFKKKKKEMKDIDRKVVKKKEVNPEIEEHRKRLLIDKKKNEISREYEIIETENKIDHEDTIFEIKIRKLNRKRQTILDICKAKFPNQLRGQDRVNYDNLTDQINLLRNQRTAHGL